jgi:hypothetical protein
MVFRDGYSSLLAPGLFFAADTVVDAMPVGQAAHDQCIFPAPFLKCQSVGCSLCTQWDRLAAVVHTPAHYIIIRHTIARMPSLC